MWSVEMAGWRWEMPPPLMTRSHLYGISAALGAGFYAASAILDYFAGRRDALPAFARIIEQAYARYLTVLQETYALERR
jgi:hypothetical protein